MSADLKITFHNATHRETVKELAESYLHRLTDLEERTIACDLTITRPHRHRRRGQEYLIHLRLILPGHQFNLRRTFTERGDPAELFKSVHEAFMVAERRLKDHRQRKRTRRNKPALDRLFEPSPTCA
ncbi:MAG: HPF/RaiA family ribosome-associated protein [Verrucomicrobiota bacterium]